MMELSFYLSKNNVWLCDYVKVEYIKEISLL